MQFSFTASPGVDLPSATFNTLVLRALGLLAANSGNDLSAMPGGMDVRLWQGSATFANAAAPLVLDTSLDWHDRILLVLYGDLGATNIRPGQANDYEYNGGGIVWSTCIGYTGKGAQKSGGGQVTASNQPVPSAYASNASYPIEVGPGSYLYLYSDPFNGQALSLYNATSATINCPTLLVFATAQTGKRT